MMNELPTYYWDFIEEYLPDYSRRDDVLLSDIYNRYLDGEEVSEEDIEYFFKNRTREDIEREYISNEWNLFLEAFENFSKARYGSIAQQPQNKPVIEQLGNHAYVPDCDGAYYIVNSRAYAVNDFLEEYIDSEGFVFEVTGPMDEARMRHFNSLPDDADRMQYLREAGCGIQFAGTANPVTRANLIKCGGMEMPAIVGAMLKEFYYNNLAGPTTMEDCIAYLAETDIAGYGFDDLETAYRLKIAGLLYCTFTGMRLGTSWNGRQDDSGGYIVVKSDDDIVAYPSANVDDFNDFLVANIAMRRHSAPTIYKKGDKHYLKLALRLHNL